MDRYFQFSSNSPRRKIKITPAHCRAARAWLGWTQMDLAINAAVSVSTIKEFESNTIVRAHTASVLYCIQETFETDGGIKFLKNGIRAKGTDQ